VIADVPVTELATPADRVRLGDSERATAGYRWNVTTTPTEPSDTAGATTT
jgi:hypothetical protein